MEQSDIRLSVGMAAQGIDKSWLMTDVDWPSSFSNLDI